MRYSVFSRSMGGYSIYEGGDQNLAVHGDTHSLGSTPQDVSSVLPAGAVKIGESKYPQGIIVDADYSPKRFLFNFAVAASAFVFSSWLVKRFFK